MKTIKIMWLCILLILFLTLCGCCMTDIKRSGYDLQVDELDWKDLGANDVGMLIGPFKPPPFSEIPQHPKDRIALMDGDRLFYVVFRGTTLGDDEKYNKELNWPYSLHKIDTWHGVYILTNSIIRIDSGDIKGIVYNPNEIYEIWSDDNQSILKEVVTKYGLVQLWPLLKGQIIVDKADKDNPLYDLFLQAEAIAKKHKKGYWATH